MLKLALVLRAGRTCWPDSVNGGFGPRARWGEGHARESVRVALRYPVGEWCAATNTPARVHHQQHQITKGRQP